MKSTILVLAVLSLKGTYVSSQTQDSLSAPKATNIVYGEVASLLFWGWGSMNYERILNNNLSVRLGIGTGYFYQGIDGPIAYGSGPVLMLYYSVVGVNHRLETGVGTSATYISLRDTESYLGRFRFTFFSNKSVRTERWLIFPAIALGYRYQPRDGGFFFRAGLTFVNYFGSPLQISGGYSW